MDNKQLIKRNFGFARAAGILMPVSSLPSPYGIGTLGQGAMNFIDFLAAAGQRVWQVLPLCPTSYGDSPYQSPAALAGNPYFIDPEALGEAGLLKPAELRTVRAAAKTRGDRVDYGWLFCTRYDLFRLAYSRYAPDRDFAAFCRRQADWLEDYALFMALKVQNGYRAWTDWPEEHRTVALARQHAEEFAAEIGFWKWLQYEFFRQWGGVRAYAKKNGVAIMGDMPIYVAHDSMDVWRAPEQFLLDENYNPTLVAGCPPDAYAEKGQLWGNPIYNWERMETDGFAFWLDRVGHSFGLYDLLRIDHFRGFAGYYVIPAGDDTAERGQWRVAPGHALFGAIREKYPNAKIIAEDLGFITDDVRALLSDTGLPGMKVIQFAFYNQDSEYLPRCYETDNCVVYTATHDSDCTRTWYDTLDADARAHFAKECPRRRGQTATQAAIVLALGSRAALAVITMQDYMNLTSDRGRINVPSVAAGNWTWRVAPNYGSDKLIAHIRALGESAGRVKKQKNSEGQV